jgi:RNA polymerase sigma factor (sigma-70 family)
MKKHTSFLSQYLHFRYSKQKYTDAEIVFGVLHNNNQIIAHSYKIYFPGIKALVYSFHSLVLDADDVFQDGLVAATRNIAENKFGGNSSFNTYLSSICRNICLKQIERANKMQLVITEPPEMEENEPDKEELIRRLTILKDTMEDNCREIIDLRFGLSFYNYSPSTLHDSDTNTKFDQIANVLNIETDNARQRFKRCFGKLKEAVLNDKIWNEILTNN